MAKKVSIYPKLSQFAFLTLSAPKIQNYKVNAPEIDHSILLTLEISLS